MQHEGTQASHVATEQIGKLEAELSRRKGGQPALAADQELTDLRVEMKLSLGLINVKTKNWADTRAEQSLCVVCLERNKGVVFMPCAHLCIECAESLDSCPLCRANIENKLRVYQ